MNILLIVIIVIGVILALGTFYVSVKKIGLRKTVINLIVEAEQAFQYGKNSEKFNYVFENLYAVLPTMIKMLYTKEDIQQFIQLIFDEIKISLNYPNTVK